MSEYCEALIKMGTIYTRIAGQGVELLREGSQPGAMIAAQEGGPAISFRHEGATVSRLSVDWQSSRGQLGDVCR